MKVLFMAGGVDAIDIIVRRAPRTLVQTGYLFYRSHAPAWECSLLALRAATPTVETARHGVPTPECGNHHKVKPSFRSWMPDKSAG